MVESDRTLSTIFKAIVVMTRVRCLALDFPCLAGAAGIRSVKRPSPPSGYTEVVQIVCFRKMVFREFEHDLARIRKTSMRCLLACSFQNRAARAVEPPRWPVYGADKGTRASSAGLVWLSTNFARVQNPTSQSSK